MASIGDGGGEEGEEEAKRVRCDWKYRVGRNERESALNTGNFWALIGNARVHPPYRAPPPGCPQHVRISHHHNKFNLI